jgi:hypothetical protein
MTLAGVWLFDCKNGHCEWLTVASAKDRSRQMPAKSMMNKVNDYACP